MAGNTTAVEEYVAPIYESNMAVRSMQGVPRFGHSDQVSLSFSSSTADTKDYSYGVLFLGIFFFSVFSFWGISLLLAKICRSCCGGGILSGEPMKEPKPSTFPRRTYQTPIWIRSIFLLSCAIVSIFSLIVAADSYIKAHDLIENSRSSLKDVSNLVHLSKNLTIIVRDIGERAEPVRVILFEELRIDKISSCLSVNATGLDQAVPGFRSQVNSVQDALNNLKGFITDKLGNLESLQNRLIKVVDDANNFINKYEPKDWWFYLFTIPVIFICTAMSVGTLWAWKMKVTPKVYQVVMNWVLLPLFILFVSLSCIVCCLVGTGSVIIADVCTGNSNLGTPDSTVLQIINDQKWDKDSLLHKGTVYYVDRCQAEYPFGFLPDYVNKLRKANTNLGILNDFFSNVGNTNTISNLCPNIKIKEIQGSISDLSTDIASLLRRSGDIIDLLGCEKTNTVYSEIMHNITCTQGSRITFFVFVSFIFISFFGMMMITLRSAWLSVEYYDGAIPMEKQIPSILVSHEAEPSSESEDENVSRSACETENSVQKVTGKTENQFDEESAKNEISKETIMKSPELQTLDNEVPLHPSHQGGFNRY